MKVIIGKSQSDTLVIGETYSYSESTNIFDGTEVSYILAYFSRNKMPNPNLIELRKESRETEKGEEITDDIKEQVYQFIKDNGINKVICFGRPAFAALFNSIARGQLISKLANKMLSECSEVPGVKASVIEYPYGYLLKEPDDIESYISGIGDVFRKSQPFEITNQEVTEDELIRWLEETDSGNYSRIGLDYETNAENQFSYKFKTTIIGFSRLAAPSIMLGSTVKAEGIWYRVPDSGLSDKLWNVIKSFLDNNYQKIWAYNCPFEIKVSKRLFGEFYEFQDTMVLMTMFDKRGSLKNVARSELGVSLWDTTVKQFLDLAETIFKRYDKKKSLTLEEKIELVKEDTEINSLISEIYWDNDEFIRLLETNWGSPWGSVPRDVLGPYCADDASYTIILAEQNDKDWMKQAYDFHIPNAYLDALFEINGTTWDETEADYQIDDLTKKAIKCLSSLILLMPRLQEFHEEPIRLKVNNILSKQLPYENVYYTPKQKKEKRVLITDELGRLGDLVAIFNPNSNTNDNRALFWDTYFTDELKKATFLELVLEEMQLKQKRHELHEEIFDMTEFKKGVKPSEILNRISVYLKEHKDDPFARELMAAGNKAGDNLPEFSNKFASDVIKLQYKVHVTYFGLDISDESTWSDEFKMLYYIFLYKKYIKVISANINGAAGRALVSEDLGKDKFGNIIRGDNVMDISDKTDKKFILDFEFNPMSAASLRWTSSAHCLIGDTRVKLTGGEVDTVENIFERIKAGETLKSNSVNEETLEMHEQEIRDVVLNAYTDELIELELDNGDIIRCTPNHRFMLSNGLYKAAESLCLEDRLMVLEQDIALADKRPIKADYPLPVYDLVMKSAGSPNFTLESGIISHNSQPAGSPFRRILKAPEDKINVHFDISQNELCVVAFLANEQTMLEGFKKGQDMHRYMASYVFNKPVDQVSGEERRATKAINFGILYSKSVYNLAVDTFAGDVNKAQAIFDLFFKEFPNIKKWIDSKHKEFDETGTYVTSYFGNRLHVERDDRGQGHYRVSQNAPIQSFGSIMAGTYMYRFAKECYKRGFDIRPYCFTHDAYDDTVAVKDFIDYMDLAFEVMQEWPLKELGLPVKIDFEVGANSTELCHVKVKHRDPVEKLYMLEIKGEKAGTDSIINKYKNCPHYEVLDVIVGKSNTHYETWAELFTVGKAIKDVWGRDVTEESTSIVLKAI